ncbi:hypothetical protein WME79_18335 [Sorangium sp. So ce726]|uniref:hypothetical protein n=1 Tax=Sorangium sp. So ce726 TaxID=3133319 RepID=UPI003F63B740
MVGAFADEDLGLVWSSERLATAQAAMASASGGPPEPLLASCWDALGRRTLDESCYQFCRDFGRQLLARYRDDPRWDLEWMLAVPSAAQACFRYWTLGVKPALWSGRVEAETLSALDGHPFQF